MMAEMYCMNMRIRKDPEFIVKYGDSWTRTVRSVLLAANQIPRSDVPKMPVLIPVMLYNM
jgi:hypothetical protein